MQCAAVNKRRAIASISIFRESIRPAGLILNENGGSSLLARE